MCVVDPRKTKLKAGFAAKTDRLDARRLADALRRESVVSIYVPNGRTLTDPHYQYKLQWLEALRTAATGWLAEDAGAHGMRRASDVPQPRTRFRPYWLRIGLIRSPRLRRSPTSCRSPAAVWC